MSALCFTVLSVLIVDQTIKLVIRRLVRNDAFDLAPIVSVVSTRILLTRLGGPCNRSRIWCIWVAAAISLLIASASISLSPVLVGLLVGGSLSQAVETSMRGSITDYVCMRVRPAFNLADLAIAAGAIGLIAELLHIVCHMCVLSLDT